MIMGRIMNCQQVSLSQGDIIGSMGMGGILDFEFYWPPCCLSVNSQPNLIADPRLQRARVARLRRGNVRPYLVADPVLKRAGRYGISHQLTAIFVISLLRDIIPLHIGVTMRENWKPIKGYEEVYEISNHGRVRRILSTTSGKAGHIMIGGFIIGYPNITTSQQ